MRFFRFVMCSLVIYGCFEGTVAKIGSENAALEDKTNKVGGEDNKIVILHEEFPNEPYVEIRTKRETDGQTEKYSAGYTVDDEDGEKAKGGLGSGDEEEYLQNDEPSAPIDGNDKINLNVQRNSSGGQKLNATTSTTRVLGQTVLTNSSTTVGLVTNAPSVNNTINIAPTMRSNNSSNTVVANPLYSTPYMRTVITIDTATVKSSPSLSSQVIASESFVVLVSRSTIVNPTGLATEQSKTIETTTKGDGDVQNQKEEDEGRKTLFGFVTIEVLVALLAGAACAVILLVILVHRLKKRNEGSYELQETLNLKTAGYAEEKEVFV